MANIMELNPSPAPVNMAQAGYGSQTIEGSQQAQGESAFDALVLKTRRENMADWTLMPSADPLRFWNELKALAGRA